MDFETAKQSVEKWITDFVEQSNPALNGWPPCPYARAARLAGLVDLRPGINSPAELASIDMGSYDVIGYIYDPAVMSAADFNTAIEDLNRDYLIPRDIIALADHPGDHEQVNGVCMNQGEFAIVFLQHLGELNDKARLLAPRGYYDLWEENYLQALFQFREDPRT